jgi:acyl carrier protein
MEISFESILTILKRSAEDLKFDQIKIETSLKKIGFDSMDKASFMLDIEETFGMAIPDSDFDKLDTIGSIIEYLEKKK